jgi:hypothetical protein
MYMYWGEHCQSFFAAPPQSTARQGDLIPFSSDLMCSCLCLWLDVPGCSCARTTRAC